MKAIRIILLSIVLSLLPAGNLSAQVADALMVKEYTLGNGLTVWLNEDHTQSKVFGSVVVKAGARDCPNTGIAHYFEHIMFKGTEKIGTINYASEKTYLDSIAAKYDELAATEDAGLRYDIQLEINRLNRKAADYAIPNEFQKLISEYGGSKLNASTGQDKTVYYNYFSPQYLPQWAELNSERLINPVFRLFQSELETVYEEKNMYSDDMYRSLLDRIEEYYYSPLPYAYPIIGSTDNLKNPKLSDMEAFFRKYYVASNMGLILCGDFDAETALPVLERTFGRIPRGTAPERKVQKRLFSGKESAEILVNYPFLKANALCYSGTTLGDADDVAMELVLYMLSNDDGSGFLDKLVTDNKIMNMFVDYYQLEEDSRIFVAILPKILFQSNESAKRYVLNEIGRIKNGDFSEQFFQSCKLAVKQKYLGALENLDSRKYYLMDYYSAGLKWEDALDRISGYEQLTIEEVKEVAKKYFGENRLEITKKKGNYLKEYAVKPPYTPVSPASKDSVSSYAKQLKTMPVDNIPPRIVDFGKDVETVGLSPLATLYITENPLNSLFSLSLKYGIGTIEEKNLSRLAHYLNYLGTEELSHNELVDKLQQSGGSIWFSAGGNDFTVSITGDDAHFDEILSLAATLIDNPKADDKKLKTVMKDERFEKKTDYKNLNQIASMMLTKMVCGEQSLYLQVPDINKSKDLLDLFEAVKGVECAVHYCGNLPTKHIEQQICRNISVDKITKPSKSPLEREYLTYDKPIVYLLDVPKSSQNFVLGYIPSDPITDLTTRDHATLFEQYLGKGMYSILFQEIREFRSLAYSVGSTFVQPYWINNDKHGGLYFSLSTQCDKTIDAMNVLDSLLKEMPMRDKTLQAAKNNYYNLTRDDYPSFRNISRYIVEQRRSGFDYDERQRIMDNTQSATIDDIASFYRRYISGKPIVYCIVGDTKKVDKEKLAHFGTMIYVKMGDIYK